MLVLLYSKYDISLPMLVILVPFPVIYSIVCILKVSQQCVRWLVPCKCLRQAIRDGCAQVDRPLYRTVAGQGSHALVLMLQVSPWQAITFWASEMSQDQFQLLLDSSLC
jgi:hypothetical protein